MTNEQQFEADVIAHFLSGKLIPRQGQYLTIDGTCGCAIGAGSVVKGVNPDATKVANAYRVNSGFCTGILRGFDECPVPNTSLHSQDLFNGYYAGKRIWDAVKHLAK